MFIQITVGILRANHDFLNLVFSNDTTHKMWRVLKVRDVARQGAGIQPVA